MPIVNRQWIYAQRPAGLVGPEHYRYVEQALPRGPLPGEVLYQARYFSVDPYMRIQQAASSTWMEPHPLDVVQGGATVGVVLESADAQIAAGSWVAAYSGWQTHALLPASSVTPISTEGLEPSVHLGVLGMPGRTAWFGLTEIGRPRAGDVVVVSGAAGAVGSLVVQYAKRHGAHVIGVAGGEQKCAWLRQRLGADAALDYRRYADQAAFGAALAALTDGVDVYFDNVGGYVSDAVLTHIRRRARIVICGQISQYSGGLDDPPLGPRLLHHLLYQRARIEGVLARDYLHRMDEMLATVTPWVRAGEIVFEESRIDGFERLPEALASLFSGDHRGKLIVTA